MPWPNAENNIAFGLRLMRLPPRERILPVASAALEVALNPSDLKKYPVKLLGGMRQRVAIARALAVRPDFIYFDEPFTALDVPLRRRMQDLIIATCADPRMTGIFITHDLFEAARIADRLAVLDSHGVGILRDRRLPGKPGNRTDLEIQARVSASLDQDWIFMRIHNVDERQIA